MGLDLTSLQDAFALVFHWKVAAIVLAAALYGIFMGAVPGLTATMAVALIVPLAYSQSAVHAFAAIVTLVGCAIFAGDLPSALVRIPGTPASAAYTDDAYALACAGRAREALGVSLVASALGGLFGALVLVFLARPLAHLAARFSYYEYFWLYVLGSSCAAVVARGTLLKGALGLGIGLGISTIGLSAVYSTPRFTFGSAQLAGGIDFIPAMVGLFGLSEVLRNAVRPPAELGAASVPAASSESAGRGILASALARIGRRKRHALRSSSLGAAIGMLPGAGADIAAWVSFAISKRLSRAAAEYGKGSLDGIADASAANNAAIAGAWVPAIVFGIPGDTVTALAISVLYMKKLVPGPGIFEKPDQRAVVYSIYLLFILANLVLIPLGALAIRAGTFLVRLPRRVLLPCVVLFTVVGAYACQGRTFDVWVMLAMGVLGFALERCGVPLGPVVLGVVLGGPLEEKLIQGLVASGGSPLGFFSRPAAAVLGVISIAVWLAPLGLRAMRRRAGTLQKLGR